jgi:hypothetical protein
MPGDCTWLEHYDWVADELVRRHETARAEYYARLEREQEAREEQEARQQAARVYRAEQSVQYAIGVLGAAAVVDLVNALQAAETAEVSA